MNLTISGTVVVVGASRGFGLALVSEIARQKLSVVGISRSRPSFPNADGWWRRGDALSASQLAGVLSTITPRPRHLVYCAGIPTPAGSAWTAEDGDLQSSFDVHVRGFMNCVRTFREPLIQNQGSVLLVGSRAARAHIDLLSSYAVGKAAAERMALSLAAEAPSGVRVNVIGIAAETELSRTHRVQKERLRGKKSIHRSLPDPSENVAAALFLLSDEAQHITGQTLEAYEI